MTGICYVRLAKGFCVSCTVSTARDYAKPVGQVSSVRDCVQSGQLLVLETVLAGQFLLPETVLAVHSLLPQTMPDQLDSLQLQAGQFLLPGTVLAGQFLLPATMLGQLDSLQCQRLCKLDSF